MAVDQERIEWHRQQEQRSKRSTFRTHGDAIERWVGVTVDTDRLDADELNELSALVNKVTHASEVRNDGLDVRTWDVGALDRKETKRWERLIEKGADMPKMFKKRREAEQIETLKTELFEHARLASRPKRVKWLEQGTIQVPAAVFDWLLDHETDFGLPELGFVIWILGVLDNKIELLGTHFDGDELVIADMQRGGVGGRDVDPEQIVMPRRMQILDNLAVANLLTVKKAGPTWRISRGPGLLAMDKDAAAAAVK
jgi:hypothetical protein